MILKRAFTLLALIAFLQAAIIADFVFPTKKKKHECDWACRVLNNSTWELGSLSIAFCANNSSFWPGVFVTNTEQTLKHYIKLRKQFSECIPWSFRNNHIVLANARDSIITHSAYFHLLQTQGRSNQHWLNQHWKLSIKFWNSVRIKQQTKCLFFTVLIRLKKSKHDINMPGSCKERKLQFWVLPINTSYKRFLLESWIRIIFTMLDIRIHVPRRLAALCIVWLTTFNDASNSSWLLHLIW